MLSIVKLEVVEQPLASLTTKLNTSAHKFIKVSIEVFEVVPLTVIVPTIPFTACAPSEQSYS